MGSNLEHRFAVAFFSNPMDGSTGAKHLAAQGSSVSASSPSPATAPAVQQRLRRETSKWSYCWRKDVVLGGMGKFKCGCDIGLRLLVLVRGMANHAAVSSRRARIQATF